MLIVQDITHSYDRYEFVSLKLSLEKVVLSDNYCNIYTIIYKDEEWEH